MEFRILGPLEVLDGQRPVSVNGPKPRSILAVLLLHAGEPVSAERLALALWGDGRARQRRQGRAGPRLAAAQGARRAGRDRHDARPGYRLRVEPGELDADAFEGSDEGGPGGP